MSDRQPVDPNKPLSATLPAHVWNIAIAAIVAELPGRVSKPIVDSLMEQFGPQTQPEDSAP